MYFPYLRGKQFELKALKDYFEGNPEERYIAPIIEPVNKSYRALEAALTMLKKGRHRYSIIMNPREGDFKHKFIRFSLPDENPDLFRPSEDWIPGYSCVEDSGHSVLDALNRGPYTNVMLVFQFGIDLDNDLTLMLINHENVEYIVVYFHSMPSPRIKEALIRTGKKIVYMEDCFKTKKRNADYAVPADEPYSSLFSFYQKDGYFGFSDYAALSSEINDGGMLPYALAIHLTYSKSFDEICIHHFVSDSNYDQTNIKGKFQEAALKIKPFYVDGRYYLTQSVQELIERADDPDGYPNLGYLKKLSVKNHLELISFIKG